MTKLPKICLTAAIATLVVGLFDLLSGLNLPSLWASAMPLSAVAFIAFIITYMMENEMAKYDQEEQARHNACQRIPQNHNGNQNQS
jgi:hypothetical protein